MESRRNSEVATTEDIIKEAAKRSGLSEKKIESVYNFLVLELKALSVEPNVYAVKLPYLGIMYLRIRGFYKKLKILKKEYTSSRRRWIRDLIDRKHNEMVELESNKTLWARKRLSSKYLRDGLSTTEMQEKQNKVYEQKNRET